MQNLQILLALGNPGEKYRETRHNFGFRALEQFQQQFNFSAFTLQKKLQAEISLGSLPLAPKIEKKTKITNFWQIFLQPKNPAPKIILVKPQTFMNLTGQTVQALSHFYHLKPQQFCVISDDLDLAFGKIRFRAQGGAGGHRGLQSIIQALQTENFVRLKLGIRNEFTAQTPAEIFVLKNFAKTEQAQIPQILEQSTAALQDFLLQGFELAATKANAKIKHN